MSQQRRKQKRYNNNKSFGYNGNDRNKIKIIKKLSKFCPECGDSQLVLIPKKIICDGVEFTVKYEFCPVCEFETKLKEKTSNQKEAILDELQGVT